MFIGTFITFQTSSYEIHEKVLWSLQNLNDLKNEKKKNKINLISNFAFMIDMSVIRETGLFFFSLRFISEIHRLLIDVENLVLSIETKILLLY